MSDQQLAQDQAQKPSSPVVSLAPYPRFESVEAELKAYREVHAHLIAALLHARSSVARLEVQRRHLLEELCANLRRDGVYASGSSWGKQAQSYARRAAAAIAKDDKEKKVAKRREEVARKTKERSIALQAREAAAAAAKKKKKGAAAARRSKKGPPKKRKQRGKDKGEGVSGAEDNSARDVSQHKKKMKVNQESSMQPLPQISDEARAKAMAAAAEEARARTTLILSLARHGDRTDTSNGKEGKPVC